MGFSVARPRSKRALRKFSRLLFFTVTVQAGASAAFGASPAVVIASAPLVSPSSALSYYDTPTSPAAGAHSTLIREMARALRYDVDAIFAHVRDNVYFLPMFGLQKGARGVILDNYGTAFDQAQFMVDLLREADAVGGKSYSPAYQIGTISLTAAQFADWTGVSDAAIATKLLANGGIPATVTGSGASFTVTMLHAWVRVTIGGTNYLFDPSFKPAPMSSSLSWKSSTGYNQSTLLAAGGGGTSTTVSGFNISNFRSKLNDYRTGLEAFLASNAAGKRADNVVGTPVITPHPTSEDRRTTLPYVVSTDRTWTGEVPDIFRTSFTVKLNGTAYGTYFADAVGGSVLGFAYSYSGSAFVPTGALPTPIVAGSFLDACDIFLSTRPSAAPAIATVSINHPYAANSGGYADRDISRQLAQQQCTSGRFFVSNDWGMVGDGISQRMAPEAARIRYDETRPTDFIFAPTLANVASQTSAFLDLAGRAQGSVFQMHDLVGIHTLDNISQIINPGSTNTATSLSMDYEGAVSAFAKSGIANDDVSAAYLAGLSLSYAEGAVPRQETDSVYDMAALNMVTQQDERATPAGVYTTYLATPSTWTTVKSALSDYPAAATSAMATYIDEEYSLLAPQKGALRQQQITVTGATTRIASIWEGDVPGSSFEIKRSAFFAWHPSGGAGSAPDRIALVIYDQRRGSILKAGIGVPVAIPNGAIKEPIRRPDAPKSESKDIIRSALNVDGRTGALSYAPATDLVDGSGDFPQSLSLQRVYDQRDQSNYGFGMGWKSNWYQVATLSNDGKAALGQRGAQAVASALVTIQALSDLVTTQDAQHLYAAAQTAAWLADQTINNSAVVTRGLDGEQVFYRQAGNNVFVAAKPDGATLTLTGSPVTGIINRRLYLGFNINYTDAAGTVRTYASAESTSGRDISSPGIASLFTRKSMYLGDWAFPNGVKIRAAYSTTPVTSDIIYLGHVYNNLGAAIYSRFYDYGAAVTGPTEGVPDHCDTPGGPIIFISPRNAQIIYATPPAYLIDNKIVTSHQATYHMTAQVVRKYTGDPDHLFCPPNSTSVPMSQTQTTSSLLDMVDPSMQVWRYSYADAAGIFGNLPSIAGIFKPGQSTADARISFGLDLNVRSIRNLRENDWLYFSTPFRSEIVTPVQAAGTGVGSRTYYDDYAQPIRSLDALSRVTATTYDDLGRPVEITRPEGDKTVKAYDVRGNVLTETRKAKPGSVLPDLVTTTAYVTGPITPTCTNPASCNKPAYVIDPRGYRTNMSWDNTTGVLTAFSQGWDGAGTTCQIAGGDCPSTSLSYTTALAGYDPVTGGAWGSLSLIAGRTDTIDATQSTMTSYGYALKDFSPASYGPWLFTSTLKRVLAKEAVVDSGGLSLRSCYGYDAAGNVMSEVKARANLGSCP